MNIKTRNTSLLALGLALLVLTGCEAAEQSAQELLDETVAKTTEAVREVVNETLGDAMQQINEQIDGLQEDADKALGEPEEEGKSQEEAESYSEAPPETQTI